MQIGRVVPAILLVLVACVGAPRDGLAEDPPRVPQDVDLVLVLDSSASMQSLVDGARDKLAKVITSIATATPEPNLRLALLTYGSPDDRSLDGHVMLRSDLTYNFDRVFDQLDAVRVRGGHEHVGSALFHALTRLSWTRNSLRIVFVAGNESADQDRARPVDRVVERMAKRGVRLNALYCGGPDDGIADSWRELAKLGDGTFANIDHNHGEVTVASPFDKELASLSGKLTESHARAGLPKTTLALMARIDARAAALDPAIAAERAILKASPLYRTDDGPAFAATASLRRRIEALAAKRRAHVADAMRSRALDDRLAFDRAVRDALRAQLSDAGFKLP